MIRDLKKMLQLKKAILPLILSLCNLTELVYILSTITVQDQMLRMHNFSTDFFNHRLSIFKRPLIIENKTHSPHTLVLAIFDDFMTCV